MQVDGKPVAGVVFDDLGGEAAGSSAPAAAPARKKQKAKGKAPGVYRVDRLLERRWDPAGGSWWYRVRWEGFAEADDTWENEQNIFDPQLIEEFHQSLPPADAPSPLAEMALHRG